MKLTLTCVCGRPLRLRMWGTLTCSAHGVVKPNDLRELLRSASGEAVRPLAEVAA